LNRAFARQPETHRGDLSRGEADLALRTPRPHHTGLVTARIAHTSVPLYASRSFLGRKRLQLRDAASVRGVPIIPQFIARNHDDLVAVSEPVGEQDVWLVTHSEYRRHPKVRATADFLKEIAKGAAGLA